MTSRVSVRRLAVFGAVVTLVACDSGPPALDLFNGVDLTGWKIHGTELWYAEAGELVCESGPDAEYGYLASEGVYRDFDLTLEFKQEADGNSGVFFRSSLDGCISLQMAPVDILFRPHCKSTRQR